MSGAAWSCLHARRHSRGLANESRPDRAYSALCHRDVRNGDGHGGVAGWGGDGLGGGTLPRQVDGAVVPVKLFAAGRRGMPNAGDAAIDRVVLGRGEAQDGIEQGDGRYVAPWARTGAGPDRDDDRRGLMTFHRLVELIRESVREADSVGALDDEIALTLTAGGDPARGGGAQPGGGGCRAT